MSMTPSVQPTNERMVFLVSSDRKESLKYRVDLTANNGASECSCRDWQTRRGPALRAGGEPWTDACLCKHTKRAGRVFLRDLLAAMAKSESQ